MAKHQNDQRNEQGNRQNMGSNQRDDRSSMGSSRGTQQMSPDQTQQRQSPGRGDEGRGRDSGGDRR